MIPPHRKTPHLSAKITFRLPHGSTVTYLPDAQTWTPEWVLVSHERDLLPYRDLITQVAALPPAAPQAVLEQAAQTVGGDLLRYFKGAGNLSVFPPPLPRPPAPPCGSLTAYLRHTPEARQAIRTALRVPLPPPPESPLLCPPLGANPGLVGTAFDYALRFLVQGLNPHLMAVRSMVVARIAAFEMDRKRVLSEVNAAEKTLQEVADGLPFGERHARAAVVLASYEVVARTGRYQDLAGAAPPEAWQDVWAMIQAVPPATFQAESQLLLNPHFAAARRFGGADADLLLDDLLVEVKATRHLTLEAAYVQQLTAYLVLDRLGGMSGSDRPVRRLGVYYARHGVLHLMPVHEVFRAGLLPQLVTWFDDSLPQRGRGG